MTKSFKYDADRDVTEIYLEKDGFYWQGTSDGKVDKKKKKLIITAYVRLYKKQLKEK